MSKRQTLPRGSNSSRLRWLPEGRYEILRDPMIATVQAHIDRAGARFYSDGSDFDVLSILAERDALILNTTYDLGAIVQAAAWRHCSSARASDLLLMFLPAIIEAELVLWHREQWLCAIGTDGSATAFEQIPYRLEDLPHRPQYWGFNRDLTPPVEALAAMELGPDYINQSQILIPLPSRTDIRRAPENLPPYLRSLNAQGQREFLLDVPSLMPVSVFTRSGSGVAPDQTAGVDNLTAHNKTPVYRFFPPIGVGAVAGTGPYDFILAGLTFLQQEFVELRPEPAADRATRRRLETTGPIPGVRTVAFRKAASSHSDDPAGERGRYDCHFLVGAHWRKPNARMKEQRPVFVRPYIKGNLDKPFQEPQQTVKIVNR